MRKKIETLLRDNEKLKNEKTIWKKNKNTESRLFTSHLGGLGSKKMESGSIYKSAMFKVLGDYSEEKEKGDKFNKNFKNRNIKKDNKEETNITDNDKKEDINKKEEDKKE